MPVSPPGSRSRPSPLPRPCRRPTRRPAASIPTIRSGPTPTAPSTPAICPPSKTGTSTISSGIRSSRAAPASVADTPARNVNTLDEVPDSSWFTNRIGRRDLTVDGDRPRAGSRGTRRRPRQDRDSHDRYWPRSTRATGRWSRSRPKDCSRDIASPIPRGISGRWNSIRRRIPRWPPGAEVIGTAFYHAVGYHVVEVALTGVDTATLKISPKATVRRYDEEAEASADARRHRAGAAQRGAARGRHVSRDREPVRRWAAGRALPVFRDAAGRSQRHLSARAPSRAARRAASSRPG